MSMYGEQTLKRKLAMEYSDTNESGISLTPGTPNKSKKDAENEHEALVKLTNETFGADGWSHSIVSQTMDFMDLEGDKYNVGVSALVKVTLKGGTFHEDIGYGISKGIKCKGLSIAKARKSAAKDGLKNALSAFNIIPTDPKKQKGKITSFLINNKDSGAFIDATKFLQQSMTTTYQGSSKEHSVETSDLTETTMQRSSSISNTTSKVARNLNNQNVEENMNHIPNLVTPPKKPLYSGLTQTAASTSSQRGDKSPEFRHRDKDWMQRKLKQLNLEMEAREQHRRDLIDHLNNSTQGDTQEIFLDEPQSPR